MLGDRKEDYKIIKNLNGDKISYIIRLRGDRKKIGEKKSEYSAKRLITKLIKEKQNGRKNKKRRWRQSGLELANHKVCFVID